MNVTEMNRGEQTDSEKRGEHANRNTVADSESVLAGSSLTLGAN